jgi:hypothetical protein
LVFESITHKAKMSSGGFGKNPDPRKKCTLCNETGHLASECPNQTGPAPAPAPAPAPPPPPARSYASAVATPITPSEAAARFARLVVYPLDPPAAKPNPAAASFTPRTAGPSPAAAPSVPSTAPPATPTVPFRPTAPASAPAAASSQRSLSPNEEKHKLGHRIGYGTRNDPLPVRDQNQAPTVLTNYVQIKNRPKLVYVYKLEIVRNTGHLGEVNLIKNRVDKMAIFDKLKSQTDYLELGTRRDCATDHDLIWATKPLFADANGEISTPQPTQRFPVHHPHTNQRIEFEEVTIHYLKCINALQSPLDLLQNSEQSADGADDGAILIRGFNAFMTQHARDNMATQHYASTAANRFFLTQGSHEQHLDGPRPRALRAFRGFSVSTRPGVKDMLLNIHVGASPFLENVSVQQLIQRLKDMKLPPRQAFNVFKNKEAVISSSNDPVTILRVGPEGIEDHMHSWTRLENQLSRLNYRRDLSDLPVNVSPPAPANPQHAANVSLHGFHAFRGAMSDEQTTAMLNFACKLPVYNRKHLEGVGFDMLGINTAPGRDRASDFGMSVAPSLLRVPARYLAPPALRYGNEAAPRDFKEASWNLQRVKFFRPSARLRKVVILDLHQLHNWRGSQPDLQDLRQELTKQLKNLGLGRVGVTTAGNADQLVTQDVSSGNSPDEKRLIEYLQRTGDESSDTILVVLPQKSYDKYAQVKRVSDLRVGRHVVCAVSDRMDYKHDGNISPQYLANVAMKINLKGAGTNHAVEHSHLASILPSKINPSNPPERESQTIIIGADVAHPTGSARPGCPSIAAVVGSTDDNYLHYPGSMRLQVSRQEFIADLADMVKERLIDWADKQNGRLPENMLFYRDGVSESQYKAVRESEIPQLEDAYQMAHRHIGGSGPAPSFKLTFIVVGKRHNTRFFTDKTCEANSFRSDLASKEIKFKARLAEEEDQKFTDNNYGKTTRMNHNILPGFVIDEVITHPHSTDFFLQSHKPLQGTGRSSHYFVLTNQMALSSDDLQRMTHALCYIYARATKGVSYCSPAYYADRLCDRGRAWLRDHLMGRMWVDKGPTEDFDDFRTRARNQIDSGNYWRPQRFNDTKYGQPRKNPWHPNLDDIMFYL